jgi:hypothetical protein
LDLGVEAGEVEAVENVVLLDLAKVFVALGGQEPRDPLSGERVRRVSDGARAPTVLRQG